MIDENKYPRPFWAVTQVRREGSGVVEDVCDCGICHPNKYWLRDTDPDGELGFGLHGCCGCCKEKPL